MINNWIDNGRGSETIQDARAFCRPRSKRMRTIPPPTTHWSKSWSTRPRYPPSTESEENLLEIRNVIVTHCVSPQLFIFQYQFVHYSSGFCSTTIVVKLICQPTFLHWISEFDANRLLFNFCDIFYSSFQPNSKWPDVDVLHLPHREGNYYFNNRFSYLVVLLNAPNVISVRCMPTRLFY